MHFVHHNESGELRLLHWNVHSWRDEVGESNLDAVVDLVRRTEPHVVSLVEVEESWARPSALDEVADRCGYASVFVPAFEFGHDAPAGGSGNALLSTLPILAVRQRQLVWPPRIFDGSEPTQPRSLLLAKLRIGTAAAWIGSTHLPRGEADSRANAVHRVVAVTQELTDEWLLLGDFNMPASDWLGAYPHLRVYPVSAELTYPADNPVETIDYCVVPREQAVSAAVLGETGSDHLAVLVRWRLG